MTGVDEARKLTLWMKANIGPREAICVKYVLNARKSSHGLIVWKRRRRRRRPGFGALRGLRYTIVKFAREVKPVHRVVALSKSECRVCPPVI